MAHKKRLFIAINLPESSKKILEKQVEDIQVKLDPSVRFLGRQNWHITVTFLGDQGPDDINSINAAIADVAARFEPPVINFEKITYGPVGRTPRMIWLIADRESSKRVAAIKEDLERTLFESGIQFEQEHRQFNAHLTLARFTALNRESLPELEISFKNNFEAKSLDLMESHLDETGSAYGILSTYEFSGAL